MNDLPNSSPLIISENRSPGSDISDTEKSSNQFFYYGYDGLYLIALLYTLPFLFGGRDLIVSSAIKVFFFLGYAIYSIKFFLRNKSNSENAKIPKVILLFTPIVLYLLLQVVPLPLSLLSVVSKVSERYYALSGANLGFISLDPYESILGLSWIVMFILMFSSLIKVPYKTLSIGKKKRKTRSAKVVYFSEQSREFDEFSELLQVVLIRVSVGCAIIGITHLVMQMNSLFGIYSYSNNVDIQSRAHWPFVNANQLAFILEIGLILSFVRLIRERQIKGLSMDYTEDKSLLVSVKDFFSIIENQAAQIFSIVIITIGLFLTMSRTGITLSLIGMTFLWFSYQTRPVKLVAKGRMTKENRSVSRSSGFPDAINSPFASLLLKLSKFIAFPIIVISLVIFFIGGDSTHNLTNRVDETYEQSGSPGRKVMNVISWKIFSESPFFGVGLNNWRLMANKFAYDDVVGWTLDYAHNEYMQLLSEIGLIGLFSAIPLFYFCVRRVVLFIQTSLNQVQKSFSIGLMLATAVPLLHAFVDFPFRLPLISFFIFTTFTIFCRNVVYNLSKDKR